MKKIIFALMLVCSISCFAAVGDVTPISEVQIYKIEEQHNITKSGKERVEIIVIYVDNAGHKRMAYMTQTDYKKYQKAQQYGIYVELELVEMKSKTKLVVR